MTSIIIFFYIIIDRYFFSLRSMIDKILFVVIIIFVLTNCRIDRMVLEGIKCIVLLNMLLHLSKKFCEIWNIIHYATFLLPVKLKKGK